MVAVVAGRRAARARRADGGRSPLRRHAQRRSVDESDFNFNEINITENGFLNEFRLAQQNLQANIAAGRGATFRYAGPGTGTAPLPIFLAYFSGLPSSAAGDAANYSSALFTNNTFINPLATFNPQPYVAANALDADAARRDNALRGRPARELHRRQSGSARRRDRDDERRRHALQRAGAGAEAAHEQRAAVRHELHLRPGHGAEPLLVPSAVAGSPRQRHRRRDRPRVEVELGLRAAVRPRSPLREQRGPAARSPDRRLDRDGRGAHPERRADRSRQRAHGRHDEERAEATCSSCASTATSACGCCRRT